MYHRSTYSQLAIFLVLSVTIALGGLTCPVTSAHAEDSGPAYHISAFQSSIVQDTLTITIVGDTVPAFTVSDKYSPFRAVIDIAGGVLAKAIDQAAPLIPANPIAKMAVAHVDSASMSDILQLEVTIADRHDYKVKRQGNDITVTVFPASKAARTAAPASSTPSITGYQVATTPQATTILLASTSPIDDYKVGTIAGSADRPARMFIDIAHASIDELMPEKNIGTSLARIRAARRGDGARIVFDSASDKLFKYSVASTPAGLKVTVGENGAPSMAATPASTSAPAPAKEAKAGDVSDSTLNKLIESSSSLMAKAKPGSASAPPAKTGVSALQDSFSFAGYSKKRISVDFYKIDIHNVFRLLKKITGLNFIVDDGVQGTLTLDLTNVPWDFALDIILNLKDLGKEERYNTIVIYPKNKQFVWPQHATDNLSFKADKKVVEQEALVIQKSANQSKEVQEAKSLIKEARTAEKNDNIEQAVSLFIKAVGLWPANDWLNDHIATLYLVNLRVNAKALFYARQGLKQNPHDDRAALLAAMAAANMQQTRKASEYFAQAISGNPPLKSALYSYAAFNENNHRYAAALKLLDKYETIYGASMNSMLAKARVLDKMGESAKAVKEYRALLASGFQLRPDLKRYISGRIAASGE